jgi:hypothetical protein
MSRSKNQHVVPRDNGWAIRGASNSSDTARFRTQQEAINAAREIARNLGSELLIHDRDGRIRKKYSYGSDPMPPRDKR